MTFFTKKTVFSLFMPIDVCMTPVDFPMVACMCNGAKYDVFSVSGPPGDKNNNYMLGVAGGVSTHPQDPFASKSPKKSTKSSGKGLDGVHRPPPHPPEL